jgi:hypothetical protein
MAVNCPAGSEVKMPTSWRQATIKNDFKIVRGNTRPFGDDAPNPFSNS